MLEIVAYVAIGSLVTLPFLPSVEMSHKKRLEVIFRRCGFTREYRDLNGKLKPKLPKYNGKDLSNDLYTDYVYSVPLGKYLDDKLENAIVSAFNQPVKVISKGGRLFVRFYNEYLPDHVPYSEVPKMNGWRIPVGKSLDGWLWHDFDKTPHMTVAGTTRQGKTVFLKTLTTYLLERNPRDTVFHLIDMKGGLEFGKHEHLRQVKGVASDVYEAFDMLDKIKDDLKRKLHYFKRKGYSNIVNTPITTRNFIVIDEAAQLTPDDFTDKEEAKLMMKCQSAMSEIARVAGALGYRLIFCTQYPTADTLPRQVKQNADGKIAFRLPTGTASRVAIDENGAEYLPNPGRAIYRTHERETVQVPLLEDDDMWSRLEPYMSKERTVSVSGRPSIETVSETDREDIIEFGED